MTSEQKKYLLDRLKESTRAKDNTYEEVPESEKPLSIVDAEKVRDAAKLLIDDWYAHYSEARNTKLVVMRESSKKVKEKILFSTAEEALKFLTDFENYDFT